MADAALNATLGEVADELYALPPAEFTAARNAAAKAAKQHKQSELAAAIGALPKPSTSAWVVNQLVRRHPEDVEALLELGEDLRAAEQARDPDRIRSLSRERNLRVPALTRQARALSTELGQPVSDAVENEISNTLTAALATPDFGAAVRSGRLTRPLLWAGFGDMPTLAGLVAGPAQPAHKVRTATRRPNGAADDAADDAAEVAAREAERAEAERAEAERAEAERAERELAEAREAAAEADRRVEELTATVEGLTQQVEAAKRQLSEARKDAKRAAAHLRGLA